MEDESQVIPFNQEDCYNKVKSLISKETEQMAACFRNGFIEGMSQHANLPRRYKEFEDYYDTIFEDKLSKKPTTEALFKNKNNGT